MGTEEAMVTEQEVMDAMQAVGTFMIGLGSFGALLVGLLARKKSAENSKKLDVLVDQTNGMAQRLESAAMSAGVLRGKEIQKKIEDLGGRR